MLPSVAIICAPTQDDAELLCKYMAQCAVIDQSEVKNRASWGRQYQERRCYYLSKRRFQYGRREFFEANCEYWSKDFVWNFISVADFIALCEGYASETDDLAISSLDAIL